MKVIFLIGDCLLMKNFESHFPSDYIDVYVLIFIKENMHNHLCKSVSFEKVH